MSSHYVVAIFDTKVEAFGNPVTVVAKGVAVRSFSDEIKNPESPMYKHPEDYILYQLGMYDDEDGSFETIAPPVRLLAGSDLVTVV